MITFTVLGAPRGWARARLGVGGSHHFTDKKTASYENMVGLMAATSMKEQGVSLLEGPVDVRLHVWLQIPASASKKAQTALDGAYATKKPDIDNAIKIVMDGLNGVAYRDDVQVARLTVEKRYGQTPRIDVVVSPAEDLF